MIQITIELNNCICTIINNDFQDTELLINDKLFYRGEILNNFIKKLDVFNIKNKKDFNLKIDEFLNSKELEIDKSLLDVITKFKSAVNIEFYFLDMIKN